VFCNVTVNICIYSLVFVSLMMFRYESKHVGDNVMSNKKVYVTQLSVFSWGLINSGKIHGQCKILNRNRHFMVEVRRMQMLLTVESLAVFICTTWFNIHNLHISDNVFMCYIRCSDHQLFP
jgi:hypothetical protein